MKNQRLSGSVGRPSHLGKKLVWVLACTLVIGVLPAHAALVSVDQIIYDNVSGANSALINGTLDISVSGSTLTAILRNTSSDGAFTNAGSPSAMLLTGFGIQLPGLDVLSGTVSVGGSTPVNFDAGQSATDISNRWGFVNAAVGPYLLPGVLSVDTVFSSMNQAPGQTNFAGSLNLGGPDYGAVSTAETQFGSSTAGIRDSVVFVLALSGTAPSVAAIDAGHVVLAFGGPNTVAAVPEPSTYALYALGISMLLVSGWWQKRRHHKDRLTVR